MSNFDPEAVRTLATILAETGLTEIEVTSGESRIRVVRAPAQVVQSTTVAAMPAASLAAAPSTAVVPAAVAPDLDDESHPGAVLSPMVGVAYLSPEPGAASYVTVGQPVAAGQTVLLIEAMKTFNQIKAPRDGVVTRIIASSGAPVEYGEALMIIE